MADDFLESYSRAVIREAKREARMEMKRRQWRERYGETEQRKGN